MVGSHVLVERLAGCNAKKLQQQCFRASTLGLRDQDDVSRASDD